MPVLQLETYEQERDTTGFGRFLSQLVEYSVLITGGAATPFPGKKGVTTDEINAADVGSGMGGRAAFVGGRKYNVTSSEQTILENAGYTVV